MKGRDSVTDSAIWSLLHDAVGDGKDALMTKVMELSEAEALQHLPLPDLKNLCQDIKEDTWRHFIQLRNPETIAQRAHDLATLGVRVLRVIASDYPKPLQQIYDPPALLYHRGALLKGGLHIAMVGSRKATHYGKEVAQRLAADLSTQGITVVSGLARGIDGQAHRGALSGFGGTVAVLGCGIDCIYPREHASLMQDILVHPAGTVLSECPLGSDPLPYRFPRRNRIIAGISTGVLVVEAAEKSGALITAQLALENGRDVYAVPGMITSQVSKGCHALIQDGAKLVAKAQDILEEYDQPSLFPERDETPKASLQGEEKIVYTVLSVVPQSLDDVVLQCGLPVEKVMSILSLLELSGYVEQLVGRQYVISKPY